MQFPKLKTAFISLSILSTTLSAIPVIAIEIGEGVLVDVTGGAKNWESGKVIAKDGRGGYTVRLLGVGDHKGEYSVPENWIFGYHKGGQASQAASATGTTASSASAAATAAPLTGSGATSGDPLKVGEGVLVDVTGGAKNWESGKIVAKDGRGGYTIKMLGVGDHKGEFTVPLRYIFGYHKSGNSSNQHSAAAAQNAGPASGAAGGSASATSSAWGAMSKDIDARVKKSSGGASTAGSGFTSNTSEAWKSLSADIDERIKKVNGQGNAAKSSGPAKPVGGSKGLNGLYLRHEQTWMGTSLNYKEDHFLFFPDGRFYNGVPPEGPGKFSWAKAQASNPDLCGQYGINGDQITLSYPGNAPITWKLKMKNANEMDMNYAPTVKVAKFGANAKLSGTYSRGSSFGAAQSYAGAPSISASAIYTFSPNGSVTNGNSVGIDGDTKVSGVTAGVRGSTQGTYSINGNDMTMSLGGQNMSCTVYPIYDRGNNQLPARISINGLLYERRK